MIKLAKKKEYTVGIMTGSFHTDYSYRIADSVCDALSAVDAEVHTVLMQAVDAKRYLDIALSTDESFDKHYYSIFEYGKYMDLDLIIASFGTISAVTSSMSIKDFFAPFKGIPVIVLEDDTPLENGISVVVDNYRGMYECVDHLINEHGAKKIMFISGPVSVPDASVRLKAYYDVMDANGIPVTDDMVVYGDFTDKIDDQVEVLLEDHPDAEAICCANDEMAESVYRVLKLHGLMPGRDIAVTGFDDSGNAAYMEPSLTTVRQDFERVAESVGRLVKQLIDGRSVSSLRIPAELIKRESCGDEQPVSEIESSTSRGRLGEDRARIKSMQTNSIVSSLLLRALFEGPLDSKAFFSRFADTLKEVGTSRAFVCLTEEPVMVNDASGYFLPDTLYAYMKLDGDSIESKRFGSGKPMERAEISAMLKTDDTSGSQLAVFPLFYRNEHYGALFVELDRKDMLLYYTLSLELGTGISFLRIGLENRSISAKLSNQSKTLEYSATHDPVTGCYNRDTMMKKARDMIKDRVGGSEYVVAIADIDHLKLINDSSGHLEGDSVIAKTADILREALPENGLIGRIGGDEFMCFFPDSGYDASKSFRTKVEDLCGKFNGKSEKPYNISITIGYHSFNTDDGIPFRDLFSMADKQLYIYKKLKEGDGEGENDIIRAKTTPLGRYVKQTEEIRALSSPQLRDIVEPGAYRENLLMNYKVIGDLASDNESILSEHIYPLLRGEREMGKGDISDMLDFAHTLENSNQGEYPDSRLAYEQGLYLLSQADENGNDSLRIEALNEILGSASIRLRMTARLYPASGLFKGYLETAVTASERMQKYLAKDVFKNLSRKSKTLVISSMRYVPFIAYVAGSNDNGPDREAILDMISKADGIYHDGFYREQLLRFDWDLHESLMLENILELTYYDDAYGEEADVIAFVEECSKRLSDLYVNGEDKNGAQFDSNSLKVVAYKTDYLKGGITEEDFRNKLIDLIGSLKRDQSRKKMVTKLFAYLEYMKTLSEDSLTDEDKEHLREFYNMLIPYATEATKLPTAGLLFSYIALFLDNFIAIPGEVSFEDMGIMMIASIHPPTFVHTLTMAKLTRAMTHRLLEKSPELFLDMPEVYSVAEVKEKSAEIEEFAYHAAKVHDFGKLLVIDNILTYGRGLIGDEKEIIKVHPSIGAYLLSKIPEDAKYADIARGHHKWFDNAGGYPVEFDLDASPYKTIVCIVECADCLDAATDTIGRSYKRGKTLYEMIGELRKGRGSRYAPYVVDLLSDETVVEELDEILEKKRDENYKETYNTLRRYE